MRRFVEASLGTAGRKEYPAIAIGLNIMAKSTKKQPSSAPRVHASQRKLLETISSSEVADFDKSLDAAYPGGFTPRDEANALIAFTIRNGPLEDLHAGRHSAILDDPNVSRITDNEMRTIMLEATQKLAQLLRLRDAEPASYHRLIRSYGMMYCNGWDREP
jgi:hypothetical protein